MKPARPPAKEKPGPIPPQWNALLWYLPVMIFLLWMWQEAFSTLAVRTIPYSDFKNYLHQGEVRDVVVKTDTIEGKIKPALHHHVPPERIQKTNMRLPRKLRRTVPVSISALRLRWRIPIWLANSRPPRSPSTAPVPAFSPSFCSPGSFRWA